MRGGAEDPMRRKQLSLLLLFPVIGGGGGCGVLQPGEGEPAGERASQPGEVRERGSARG